MTPFLPSWRSTMPNTVSWTHIVWEWVRVLLLYNNRWCFIFPSRYHLSNLSGLNSRPDLLFSSHAALGNIMNQQQTERSDNLSHDACTGHGVAFVLTLWSKWVSEVTAVCSVSAVNARIIRPHAHPRPHAPSSCNQCRCWGFDRCGKIFTYLKSYLKSVAWTYKDFRILLSNAPFSVWTLEERFKLFFFGFLHSWTSKSWSDFNVQEAKTTAFSPYILTSFLFVWSTMKMSGQTCVVLRFIPAALWDCVIVHKHNKFLLPCLLYCTFSSEVEFDAALLYMSVR